MIADRQIDLDRTVAVYFRGTDKSSEVKPTDVARYIEAAERAIAGRPDFRVLVQSDQAQFRDALAAHFGDRCVWFDELPVTTGSVGIHHSGIDVQQVYGVSRFEMAKRFLAAVHLMARVHHVITGTTNVGLWIALYRGHAERLWQFDAQQELVET